MEDRAWPYQSAMNGPRMPYTPPAHTSFEGSRGERIEGGGMSGTRWPSELGHLALPVPPAITNRSNAGFADRNDQQRRLGCAAVSAPAASMHALSVQSAR
jgi:hypothetical protein